MLNNPKFLCPSTNVNECVVDADSGIVDFSCIVDGNEAIKKCVVKIFNLESLNSNEPILEYEKEFDDSDLFYPINEKNQNNILKISIRDDSKKIVNRSTPYYWNITVIGVEGSLALSCDEVFYCNKIPLLSLEYKEEKNEVFKPISEDVPISLSSKIAYFKGIYNQEQGIPLKRYGWRLINTDTGQVLLDTISKRQIYGTSHNILCSYDGLLDGSAYSVELFVETQNGQKTITEPYNFKVSYKTAFLTNDFRVEPLIEEPGVMLDWSESIVIEGKPNGNVERILGFPVSGEGTSAHIGFDASINYDYGATSNLDVNENSCVVLSTQLLSSEDMTLLDMEGVNALDEFILRRLRYSEGCFFYTVSRGNHTKTVQHTLQRTPWENVWYIIILYPLDENGDTRLSVTEFRATNALYPSDDKFPSEQLYPNFGVWGKINSKDGE